MRLLQQVMSQRHIHVVLNLRASNQTLRVTQEAARSDCRSDVPTWMRPDRRCQIEATHISFQRLGSTIGRHPNWTVAGREQLIVIEVLLAENRKATRRWSIAAICARNGSDIAAQISQWKVQA